MGAEANGVGLGMWRVRGEALLDQVGAGPWGWVGKAAVAPCLKMVVAGRVAQAGPPSPSSPSPPPPRSEIKDMTCYLRLVCNPAVDTAALEVVINNPPRGIGELGGGGD